MEFGLIFKALVALVFVIGLLFVTLWAIKSCQLKGAQSRFLRKLQNNKRIHIIENHRIDLKNSLLLFSKDETEYLILLGATQNLLLEDKNIVPQDGKNA